MRFHQIDEFIMLRWNIQGTGIQDTIKVYKVEVLHTAVSSEALDKEK